MFDIGDCFATVDYANIRTRKRREQRKRAKDRKMSYGQGYEQMLAMNKLVSVMHAYQVSAGTDAPAIKKSGENPMYVDYVSSDKHSESAKINYLLSQFTDVRGKNRQNLRKQFGLENENAPVTPQELIDRITAGKYVLPTEQEANFMRYNYGYSLLNQIKWRDPAIKEDQVGFNLAETEMDKAAQDVHDAIMLKTNDEALAALKAFKSWKPTGKTN